jgi:hypothetical protein
MDKEKIKRKIADLYEEMKPLIYSIEKLSSIPEIPDLVSPKEHAWRKINYIHGQITSLKWVLKGDLK